MPDVYLGRFNRWVEKLFNVKGGPTLVDIDHRVSTVLSFQPGNEERYLVGWNRYAIIKQQAAVAAQNSFFVLRNPAASNVVVVVEKIFVLGTVATPSQAHLSIAQNQTDAATTFSGFRLDSRSNLSSTAIFSQSTAVAPDFSNIILAVGFTNLPGVDMIITETQELTLMPGDAIRVVDATLNEAFDVSFFWRERALETSELA